MDGEDRRFLVIATVCCTRQAGKGQTAMEVEKLLKYIGTFQLFNIGTIWKYLIGFFQWEPFNWKKQIKRYFPLPCFIAGGYPFELVIVLYYICVHIIVVYCSGL